MQITVTYIQTNEESNDVNLGETFLPKNGFACISMYVQMCTSCTMMLSLKTNSTRRVLNNVSYVNVSSLILRRILDMFCSCSGNLKNAS